MSLLIASLVLRPEGRLLRPLLTSQRASHLVGHARLLPPLPWCHLSSLHSASVHCPSSNPVADLSAFILALNYWNSVRLHPRPSPLLMPCSLHSPGFREYLFCRLARNFCRWPNPLLSTELSRPSCLLDTSTVMLCNHSDSTGLNSDGRMVPFHPSPHPQMPRFPSSVPHLLSEWHNRPSSHVSYGT